MQSPESGSFEGSSEMESRVRERILKTDWEEWHIFCIGREIVGHVSFGAGSQVYRGAWSIRQAPLRAPACCQEALLETTDNTAEQGVTKPWASTWAPSVVLVTKRDGSLRICVGYQEFDEVTKTDAPLFPRTDDTLNASALDSTSFILEPKYG